MVFAAFYFHQAPTRRHDVEHQTVFECRQCQRPGRREFRPALQTPVIRRKCRASPNGSTAANGIFTVSMRPTPTFVHELWMNEPQSGTFEPCSAECRIP